MQAWKQVAHALAVAEEEMEFEHRDLHWGNVLVKETSEKFVNFKLGGDIYQVVDHLSLKLISYSCFHSSNSY